MKTNLVNRKIGQKKMSRKKEKNRKPRRQVKYTVESVRPNTGTEVPERLSMRNGEKQYFKR